MGATLQPLKELSLQEQAIYFHSRQRRRSLAGIPEMFRTHKFVGTSVIGDPTIATSTVFPVRTGLVTFKTAIRIVDTGSVPAEHRGLVFEFGGAVAGAALWIGDQTISFHAGDSGLANGATTEYDNGVELPVGAEFELVAAARPGDGRVRLWANGQELFDRTPASNGAFTDVWASTNDGSFASAKSGTIITDVPAASDQAPDGFEVIEPLSVYVGQVPRHFV